MSMSLGDGLLLSSCLTLFLIMDPLGNVPIFLAELRHVSPARRWRVILRELLVALGLMLIFLGFGRPILSYLGLERAALQISGGVILFLLALKMIFPQEGAEHAAQERAEPFIVPLAIPLVAGPSTLATLMLMTQQHPQRLMTLAAATLLAWALNAAILLASPLLYQLLGTRGLKAVERLMGMILIMLATQMLIHGARSAWLPS